MPTTALPCPALPWHRKGESGHVLFESCAFPLLCQHLSCTLLFSLVTKFKFKFQKEKYKYMCCQPVGDKEVCSVHIASSLAPLAGPLHYLCQAHTPLQCSVRVQCSVWKVWSVQCVVYSVQCAKCEVCSVKCAKCEMCSVQCAKCEVCSVRCAVQGVEWSDRVAVR